MLPTIIAEIKFKTARSDGKGGQNLNKVETMVEAYWHIPTSAALTTAQKNRVQLKLANKINTDGFLQVKSQMYRTQLANKTDAQNKLLLLVQKALIVPKKRVATAIPKAAIQKRINNKMKIAEIKQLRKKLPHHE